MYTSSFSVVPWDTSVLKWLKDYILTNIGNGTNVGIIIFAAGIAILLCLAVFKGFIRG